MNGIPDSLGTAVNVQAMVFGNLGDTSATGVGFTRNPSTGENKFYGIPGNQGRGLKVASDVRGSPFDPTSGERTHTEEGLQAARGYLEFRFPSMRGAPLLESRVCQYEQTRDGHFILDRHPEARNVWIAGGGSGHGFKHGPALGEMAARMLLEVLPPCAEFALSRFSRTAS